MPRDSLGDVEHFVLVALLRLDGESYAVPIMREIRQRTGREVARAAVYIALKRLEAKTLVRSRMGDATAERGGRPKRFFTLTRTGALQLRQSREEFVRMWADAERLLQKAVR
jgi:PadR family transcriptional regulator PadR